MGTLWIYNAYNDNNSASLQLAVFNSYSPKLFLSGWTVIFPIRYNPSRHTSYQTKSVKKHRLQQGNNTHSTSILILIYPWWPTASSKNGCCIPVSLSSPLASLWWWWQLEQQRYISQQSSWPATNALALSGETPRRYSQTSSLVAGHVLVKLCIQFSLHCLLTTVGPSLTSATATTPATTLTSGAGHVAVVTAAVHNHSHYFHGHTTSPAKKDLLSLPPKLQYNEVNMTDCAMTNVKNEQLNNTTESLKNLIGVVCWVQYSNALCYWYRVPLNGLV